MNKRMREPFHTLMWKASIGYNDSWSQVNPEVLEQFAELIIRQCSEICLSNQFDGAEHYNNGSVSCSELIKHHFGIE